MNVLILEDESLASEKLIKLINEVDPNLEIVGTLKSIESALIWFESNPQPDLIFSDIQLLDGLCRLSQVYRITLLCRGKKKYWCV